MKKNPNIHNKHPIAITLAKLTHTYIIGVANATCFRRQLQIWNQIQKTQPLVVRHQSHINLALKFSTRTAALKQTIEQERSTKLPDGTDGDVFSCNLMIRTLIQNGKIIEARQLFDNMNKRDVFTWTAMVAGYAQNGAIENARQLFDIMPERNVVSWTAMISGYTRHGRIEEARHLFDKMPERNVFSWTAMIAGYAQNGRIEDARHLFDIMPDRNVVSWTAMVSGYAQNGRIDDARRLFDKMPEKNVVSWTVMITEYVQNGRLEDARQLFDQMPVRNSYSWNTMIAGYAQNHRVDCARELFDRMPKRNVISWTAMIAGYAQNGKIKDARQLFDRIPKRDVVSWNAIITGYFQNGKIDEARQLFDRMPERNVVSWNAIIAGYVQNGYGEEALKVFAEMLRSGSKPKQSTFTSILSTCASLAAMQLGKQVHKHITKMGFDSEMLLGNALITMYAKCGSIYDARQVFDKMPVRDKVSWTTTIVGYTQHGRSEEALQLFEEMKHSGMKPDHITFVGVLSACSHAGLVYEGRCFFSSMSRDYCIQPTMEHYACMVDLLGRCGRVDEAEDIINNMPFDPDAVMWGALLGACRIHGKVDLGERAAEKLFELEPQNAATYVLLSNIYAAAGRWDDVAAVRMKMKNRGVTKQPGCSWIEVKNKVHAFLVGDRSHPQTEKIYSTLEALARQMKDLGYSPNTNFVLHDVEEEEKEQFLCHHSEKLAIAFGLISTQDGAPIQIVKNLRVCGDCHNAAKFISKIAVREIVMRDPNLFHHFKDGFCSCQDYW
eukprot:Gb_13717 [translate_table: standard]